MNTQTPPSPSPQPPLRVLSDRAPSSWRCLLPLPEDSFLRPRWNPQALKSNLVASGERGKKSPRAPRLGNLSRMLLLLPVSVGFVVETGISWSSWVSPCLLLLFFLVIWKSPPMRIRKCLIALGGLRGNHHVSEACLQLLVADDIACLSLRR